MSGPVVCSVLLTEDQLSLIENSLEAYVEYVSARRDILPNYRMIFEFDDKIKTIRLALQRAKESGRVD